ncbi:YnfA family protein [Lentzea sp. NPDC004789]
MSQGWRASSPRSVFGICWSVWERRSWWVLARGWLYGVGDGTTAPSAGVVVRLPDHDGSALVWGVVMDGFRPDRWDYAGAIICLLGVVVIMYAPRG